VDGFLTSLARWIEHPAMRFSISGTLITLYVIVDVLARRRHRAWRLPPVPRWVHPLVAVSLIAFYALIGPAGGPILNGAGNLAGVALTVLAATLRFSTRVRYPELAGRCLLYGALPLAVGVPGGFLVLTLPACVASLYCAWRADRFLGDGDLAGMPAHRVLPGIW
jgi:hypothetical protein